ncbi:hypothetical protein BY996DRAFT_6420302 [Phakopsora pachyrhizi]|nr:hypothetical protein BY996DRAFT_6420302 [Phakopsora pachyrhizi]
MSIITARLYDMNFIIRSLYSGMVAEREVFCWEREALTFAHDSLNPTKMGVAACVGNVLVSNVKRYNQSRHRRIEVVTGACTAGAAFTFSSPVGGALITFEAIVSI